MKKLPFALAMTLALAMAPAAAQQPAPGYDAELAARQAALNFLHTYRFS